MQHGVLDIYIHFIGAQLHYLQLAMVILYQ